VTWSVRRVPGLMALSATNLLAALIAWNPDSYAGSPIQSAARAMMPAQAWAALWLTSAVGLLVAIPMRSTPIATAAGGFSLAVWVGHVGAAVSTAVTNHAVNPSPIAWALWLWMIGGQAAMVFAPFWRVPTLTPPRMDQ